MNLTRIYIDEKLAYAVVDHWDGQRVHDFINKYHRLNMKTVRYEHIRRDSDKDWDVVSVKKFIWFTDRMAFVAA